MGQRIFECVLLIGTRSAQSIRASGFTAAQTGRTHDRTRPMLQQLRKFLPRRRRRFCCDAHPDLLYFHNLWGAMEQREFITLLGHAALYD